MAGYSAGSNGGGSGSGDLIEALAGAASNAYQTNVIANANPLNAALITGGSASTPYGSTAGASTLTSGLFSGSSSSGGILLLIIAAIVIVFALR